MQNKDTIILDFETTGLLKPSATEMIHQPHAIELYAMRVDKSGNILDEIETFFSVPVVLERHITKITGINENMLQGAPEFSEKYSEICSIFLGCERMVAHNLPFDAGIMWCELVRIGREFQFPWPPDWYCTIEHSMYIENKRLKLGILHKYATGKEFKDGAHRAKQDVLALQRCYNWLLEEENDRVS